MRIATLGLLAVLPVPALAQSFGLPAGCTAYLTVQMTSCTVSHHFTCTADPQGVQRRVDLDGGGVTYVGAIDAEGQWLESGYLMAEFSERLGPPAADPASMTTLIDDGIDTYDFTTRSDEIGTTRYVGADSLTGRTVTIDGVALDETSYTIRSQAEDGTLLWSAEGNEYLSRDWRLFLSGAGRTTFGEETVDSDDTPVEFIEPGEPGFLSPDPKHGCNATLSSWTPQAGDHRRLTHAAYEAANRHVAGDLTAPISGVTP